ncbi:MAG TPA: NAD(P)H-hydrate epimerase, partial [Candidatus Binatus sp.]|nr:NAD(P)H-hydrate epimerase [Candidatus Binatus sp.]
MIAVTTEEMRALDRWTIEHGTPGHVLMERAGAGATRVLRERLRAPRGCVVVVCGPGNNGGDGFVIARHLRRARVPVEVWLTARPDEVRGDAARMLARWRGLRGTVHDLTSTDRLEALARRLAGAAAVVDALFGTGLNAPVRGVAAGAIAAINACGAPVLAVDIASGLSADTGTPLGAAVRATVTATFGYPKVGQVVYPGVEHTGLLAVVDIGIPPEAVAAVQPRV